MSAQLGCYPNRPKGGRRGSDIILRARPPLEVSAQGRSPLPWVHKATIQRASNPSNVSSEAVTHRQTETLLRDEHGKRVVVRKRQVAVCDARCNYSHMVSLLGTLTHLRRHQGDVIGWSEHHQQTTTVLESFGDADWGRIGCMKRGSYKVRVVGRRVGEVCERVFIQEPGEGDFAGLVL